MNKKIMAILLACSFATQSAAIIDGSLDGSFGKGTGIVTTPIGSGNDQANALMCQPDGKLVAAGYLVNGSDDFALARYNADGSLDSSFGTGGIVTTNFGHINNNDRAYALICQTDCKIVAAGYSDKGFNENFALARYNSDGSLDNSFGMGGKVTTDFESTNSRVYALICQPDGKLVAAGVSDNDFALVRYNSDGSLDSSFGIGGKVTTPIGNSIDQARTLILQPDGKIVAAGYSANESNYDFALARYNSDGSLDSSFGPNGNGKVTTPIGNIDDQAYALILQPDGKIVAAGTSGVKFGLVRYNSDGSLDTSFGSGGKVTTQIGNSNGVNALILQPDGKLVAAGYSDNGSNDVFALVRYNPDGSLDTSFGPLETGSLKTNFGNGTDRAQALIAQPDGKLVAAGFARIGSNDDFALVRYLVPSLEISSVARDIRAKYRPLIPSDRNGTQYDG